MSPVLVTGSSGYVGTQLTATLLRAEQPVRAGLRGRTTRTERLGPDRLELGVRAPLGPVRRRGQ